MDRLRKIQPNLLTLSGKCLVDDLCNEYGLGVWTLFELRMGLRNTYANAEGDFRRDVGSILSVLG